MTFIDYLFAFAVAALGGAVNSVAGGGTFLTFPTLIFLGLSPLQANITSTIALWPGSVASAVAYRREWNKERAQLPMLLAISLAGAAVGAGVLLLTPEQRFAQLVPWLLLIATLIFTFGSTVIRHPRLARGSRASVKHPGSSKIPAFAGMTGKKGGVILQFFIAFYGGYFGAGIGILMLAMLQLMGLENIHRMNALKTVLGSAINAVAVVIFLFSGMVVWGIGLVMLAGAVAGGWYGASLAQRFSPARVRLLVIVIAWGMTGWFFWQG